MEKFRSHWKNYVFQSFFATLTVFIVLLILNTGQAVIVAAIGATAFIVFAMPKSITANPRNIIGGYIVGLVCGSLFAFIPHQTAALSAVVYALAVGSSIFIMVVIDTEHPPASAVALGVAMRGFSLEVAITVVVTTVVLSIIRSLFGKYLEDLV